jgi:hypothetical protein
MHARAVITAGIVLLAAGACARKKPGADAAGNAMAAGTPPEVQFTARDFAFEGPDTISAGWTTVVLHNAGPNLHHFMLLQLTQGKTLADLKAAVAAMKSPEMPPLWAVPVGGVNPPMPGSDTRAMLDVQPGDYAIVCIVDVPDHVPHMMKGMIKGLTVTAASAAAAAEPVADMTVTAVDFAFAPSAEFTAGHHLIKFENKGTEPHEFELVRLGDGKTVDDLMKWGQTLQGPLPGTSLGGAAPLVPGQVEYVPVDLTPGNYVVVCFVPDPTKQGMPHVAEGMLRTFTIS